MSFVVRILIQKDAFVVGPRGLYNTPCLTPDEACSDTNTECRNGLCLCAGFYFRRDDVCGQYLESPSGTQMYKFCGIVDVFDRHCFNVMVLFESIIENHVLLSPVILSFAVVGKTLNNTKLIDITPCSPQTKCWRAMFPSRCLQ